MNELTKLIDILNNITNRINSEPSAIYDLLFFIYNNYSILNNENPELNNALKNSLKLILDQHNIINITNNNNNNNNCQNTAKQLIASQFNWRMKNKFNNNKHRK